MARTNNINYRLQENIDIDLKASGGPSTCVLVSMEEDKFEELKSDFPYLSTK